MLSTICFRRKPPIGWLTFTNNYNFERKGEIGENTTINLISNMKNRILSLNFNKGKEINKKNKLNRIFIIIFFLVKINKLNFYFIRKQWLMGYVSKITLQQ